MFEAKTKKQGTKNARDYNCKMDSTSSQRGASSPLSINRNSCITHRDLDKQKPREREFSRREIGKLGKQKL